MVRTKRVYEPAAKEDGYRVLVDRLWPRGMKKEAAKIDLWLKDVAPSDALRKSFHHDDMKWPIFEKKYQTELQNKKDSLAELKSLEKKLTLPQLRDLAADHHQAAPAGDSNVPERQQ